MTERHDAPSLLQQVRAHAKARDSIAWSGQARQLLLWAADTIEAANAALRSEKSEPEGYPGIAHDFEKMRAVLEYISRLPDSYPSSAIVARAKDALKNAAPQGNKAGTPLVEAGKGSASSTDRTLPNEPAEPASPACASPNRHADLVADLQCAIAALNNSAPGMRREELALLCQRAADALSERLNTDKEAG